MRSYLKDNDIRIKSGTDVNSVMRDIAANTPMAIATSDVTIMLIYVSKIIQISSHLFLKFNIYYSKTSVQKNQKYTKLINCKFNHTIRFQLTEIIGFFRNQFSNYFISKQGIYNMITYLVLETSHHIKRMVIFMFYCCDYSPLHIPSQNKQHIN